MKALSIRQPWAWLIVNGYKDIENRSWHTKHRGRFIVHAAKGMTRQEYADVASFADIEHGINIPQFDELQRGGIIGSVELLDSLDTSASPWYMGQIAFLLHAPQALPFVPFKGQLGFFDVPEQLISVNVLEAL